MKELVFKPEGVCSKLIKVLYENDTIKDLKVVGGCPGNSLGISMLAKGQKIDDVINRLSGIKCGAKNTSCPDQISKALKSIKK